MRLVLATVVVSVAALITATAPKTPTPQVPHICATREPASVDRTLDKIESSSLFNAHVNSKMLANNERAKVTNITQYLQQAAMRQHLWKAGSTLKIGFLSGDPTVRTRIQASASQWTNYANIHFQFVDDPSSAAIRIGIDLNNKSYSQVGTDALSIDVHSETMHFGWLLPTSSQADYDSVVLHEFGHALGLLHEHQIPSSTIKWNEPYVYNVCETQLGWTRDDVYHNIFEKYTPEQAIFTSMDPASIMMYSFPASWTANVPPISTPWNYKLSDADKQFIALEYPK